MDQWEVDELLSTIGRISAETDRAFQIDQMVQVVSLLMKAATVEKVEELLYEGESPGDVDLAVRVSDHLQCVGAPFENWWEKISPNVRNVAVLCPVENELAALRKQADSLEAEIINIRKKRDDVSRQQEEVQRLIREKRDSESELLARDQQLHESEKQLGELRSSIEELGKLEEKLSPDIVRGYLESALTAERSNLLLFEEAIKSIAEHSKTIRISSESILRDDQEIHAALCAVEKEACAAGLLKAGRLADEVHDAFERFSKAVAELEDRIGKYLRDRDRKVAR